MGGTYHPNENLAQAIANAWSDESYMERLLTFPLGQPTADFKDVTQAMLRKTSGALAEVDVYLNKPVVLTVDQFENAKEKWLSHEKSEKELVVFIMPKPLGKRPSLATAKIAMAMRLQGV